MMMGAMDVDGREKNLLEKDFFNVKIDSFLCSSLLVSRSLPLSFS
jgi:hypothetical protein